jgi:ABC-type Fe3+/spermidine/putrescine transport system ATPase subunit
LTPSLELRSVAKRYGATLGVGPIDFEVRQGEFLTLLGPSGCGKTTTLHVIAGLLFPDEGAVLVCGRDVTRVEPQHRDMGLVFQNYALFPHKTVFDNVAFGLRMRRMAREEIRERATRMLELVGLPGVEGRYPDQLSGGQRQRVALARALVIEPSLLLLDEPLSNLDAVLRKRMRHELRELQQRLGIATIFVTHDQEEAFEMSDRVVLLNRGRIEQISSPEEMYDAPASRFAAQFIGEANLILGAVVACGVEGLFVQTDFGGRFPARSHEIGLRAGQPVFLMVRPERVGIAVAPPPGGQAVAVRVVKRVFAGDMLSFTLRTEAGQEVVAVKPNLAGYREIGPEAELWMTLDECRALPRNAE